jgi:CRISPR-associated endoribonuclease Cas6
MHYSQIYEGDNEVDPDTVDYIDQHARITAYHLRSQYFDHAADSGKKIPAFVGSLTIGTKGPQALTGLAHMLLSFGEYAGIGIKTSMGMGGVTCSQIEGASKTSAPTAKRK